jgi:hypothetical protein
MPRLGAARCEAAASQPHYRSEPEGGGDGRRPMSPNDELGGRRSAEEHLRTHGDAQVRRCPFVEKRHPWSRRPALRSARTRVAAARRARPQRRERAARDARPAGAPARVPVRDMRWLAATRTIPRSNSSKPTAIRPEGTRRTIPSTGRRSRSGRTASVTVKRYEFVEYETGMITAPRDLVRSWASSRSLGRRPIVMKGPGTEPR